jgi:chromosome segregation ATPase
MAENQDMGVLELVDALNEARAEKARLQESNDGFQREVERLQDAAAELKIVKAKLAEVEQVAAEREAAVVDYSQQAEAEKGRADVAERALSESQVREAGLLEANAVLQTKVDAVEPALKAREADVRILQAQVDELAPVAGLVEGLRAVLAVSDKPEVVAEPAPVNPEVVVEVVEAEETPEPEVPSEV